MRTLEHCKAILGMRNGKVAWYVIMLFLLIQVAAKNDTDHPVTNSDNTEFHAGEGTSSKIRAFKRGGPQKKISTVNYSIDDVIKAAHSLKGTPHVMGGYSAKGIDCSGLVSLAHLKAGVQLPRSSHDQARYGRIIESPADLQRGDVVFFHSTYKKKNLVTHTGIYLVTVNLYTLLPSVVWWSPGSVLSTIASIYCLGLDYGSKDVGRFAGLMRQGSRHAGSRGGDPAGTSLRFGFGFRVSC